jgi:type II secretory pathway pseudopilin PulG
MTNRIPIRRHIKPSEEGYMLVAVMFLLFILVIAMATAAPIIKKQIQHDQDVETMHRGKQYARAIKMYYKKFGAYPPNLDALVNTNNMRFLRRKYADPTAPKSDPNATGKSDWKIIHLGQNKVPTAWGFFGQPLNGAGGAAGCGIPGLSAPGTTPGLGNSGSSTSGFGPSGIGSGGSSTSGFGSSGFGVNGTSGSSTSGCSPAGSSDSSSTSGNGSTDPNNPNANTGSNTTGSNTTGPNAPGGSTGTGAGTGQTGQTFGGAGIMGVSPNSPKQSILVLHKKNHYNQWEFCYDPASEQLMMQGGATGLGGTGVGGNGVGGNGAGGSGAGGSGFGGTGAGGTGAGGNGSGSAGSGGSSGSGSTTPPATPPSQ